MLIGIISDSHDNVGNLKQALLWMQKNGIGKILHCGDIVHLEMLAQAWPEDFLATLYCVKGNGDFDHEFERVPKILDEFLVYFGEVGELEIKEIPIAFCHQPKLAKELANTGKYQMVFYGHTHKPWIEKIGATFMINPGNLGGQRVEATLAIYDTVEKRLDLKKLADLIV